MVNKLNMLIEDLDTQELQNQFSEFISHFVTLIPQYLSNIKADTLTTTFFNDIVLMNNGEMISNYLGIKCYMYETPLLLKMFNFNVNKLSLDFFLKVYTPIFTLINEMNLLNSQNYINYGNFGVVNATQTQSNNTYATSTNDTTGELNFNSVNMNGGGVVTNNSYQNNPTTNINIPLNEVDNTQNSNLNFNYNGLDSLRAFRDMSDKVQNIVEEALEYTFKKYFVPFWSPLQEKRGFNF